MRSGARELVWLPSGGHLGDAVMVLAALSEALERDPALRVTYLARRNAPLIAQLASATPRVCVVEVPYAPLGALKVVLPLFAGRRIIIAPPAWNVHPLVIKLLSLALRLRGDEVVGFDDGTRFQPWRVTIYREKQKERYIDSLRRALNAAGLATAPAGAPPQLNLATALPADFPFKNREYVVVHPFPHMATFKTMPLRRWKDLTRWLTKEYPSLGLVVTGGEADRASAEELAAAVPHTYVAVGKPLAELAGLIEHAALYVGVDTGPTHIAGVLQVKSVVLAQQKEPAWLPTYNPNATLIWSRETCVCNVPGKECLAWEDGKAYRRCVYDISDEALHAAVNAALSARA
jgi:ADP-heptose:LPS heptosyltransferase